MYLHKYLVNGETLYRVSADQARPAGTIMISNADWKGRVSGKGKIESALSILEHAFHPVKEEPAEKEPKKEEAPKEEKPSKKDKKALSEIIRGMSFMLPTE